MEPVVTVDFEDFLGVEVFDEQQALIGTLICFWGNKDNQAQFLGVELRASPERTCVIPVSIAAADEARACIRVQALDKDIVAAPALDCDERLNHGLEEEVYTHFRLSPPTGR